MGSLVNVGLERVSGSSGLPLFVGTSSRRSTRSQKSACSLKSRNPARARIGEVAILLAILLIPVVSAVPARTYTEEVITWIPFIPGAEPTRSQVLPKSEDTMGLCVDTNFFGMYHTSIYLNETRYDKLDVPNAGYVTAVGKPAVPMVVRYLEIPENVDVNVEILYRDTRVLDGFNVVPAQEPQVALQNATEPPFTIDKTTYATDAFYPSDIALIEGADRGIPIIIRGHRIVTLGLFPVQFNPVTKQLRVYSKIEVRLNYDRPGQVGAIDRRLYSTAFVQLFQALFLNYKDRKVFETKRETGADYLIITHDNFYKQALDLAAWKERKGLKTRVVNTTQINAAGPTANDITTYIKNAYETWNPAPTYVSLIGDSEFVPTHYGMVHPARSDNTLYHGGAHIATDLFYFTVDGADYFPDIFYGRLSVDTPGEAKTLIDKILNYEQTPPVAANFYDNVVSCSYFEDTRPQPPPPAPVGDGREDFPFVLRVENVSAYLQGQGYTVDQLYWADRIANPAPARLYDGSALPNNLLPPGYAWNFGAGDIRNAIDDNRSLVYHIDHGDSRNFWNYVGAQWGGFDGWHRPRFTAADILALANGNRLPVVISIDCNVGWFDGETDQTDDPTLNNENNVGADIECFSEVITRLPNAGAVAAIGSTRLSYIFANDELMEGLIDAIWTDYDATFDSGGLYNLGQVLMYGKLCVASRFGYNSDFTNTTFHLYHLFGDPEMWMWTQQPKELDVSCPTQIGSNGLQRFVVNVTDHNTGVPIQQAIVCLQKENEVYSVASTDPAGGAYFAVHPYSDGEMNVTVTKHNYRPYIGLMMVTSGGAVLSTTPVFGPSGISASLQGNNFDDGEAVDIYFGGSTPDTTFTASAGSFVETFTVPTGPIGPLNVVAIGKTSGRRAVALFRRLPDQPLPDPYIYDQWDPSTWHINPDGGDPRWNNPDIKLLSKATGALVSSNNLKVMTTYTIRVTIHNDATVDATDTRLTLHWAFWGAGQRAWTFINTSTVTVPATGQATVDVDWTPSVTGHTCINVTIYHPWDENLDNNVGQENTHVQPVSSPGEIIFTIGNPTQTDALAYVGARQVGTQEIWSTHVERDYPQVQKPGENRTATLVVEPPADTNVGEKRTFTVSCYINGELIGGIEVEVIVKVPTTISCSASPSEVTQGGSVTVSGSISPVVSGATVILVYTKPDGTTLTRTAITGSDGSYSDSYRPDATGSWSVAASWYGDATRDGSLSSTKAFTVKEPPIICPIMLVLILALVIIVLILTRGRGRKVKLLGLILVVIALLIYFWVCIR